MCLYFGVRCVWMCGSFGGAVHVNSGVREGSPSRRSYEGCATIVYPTSKTVSAIWPKCIMGVHSLIWLSVLKAYGSFKCICKIELYVMSDLSDKSEQKYSQQIFMSYQSVFAAQFALNAQLPVKSDNSFFFKTKSNAKCAEKMLCSCHAEVPLMGLQSCDWLKTKEASDWLQRVPW